MKVKPSPDPMRRESQLRLELQRPTIYSRETFVVSHSNTAAVAAVDSWPHWHGGRLALVGPESCGKTHLAMAWAAQSGAVLVADDRPDLDGLGSCAMVLEDADRRPSDERLFHLINMADAGASLLITARTTPASWPAALPDLRSRLNALAVAQIEAPDDGVLEGVLRKFFRERNIRPAADVYSYLVKRIERSVPAALDVVSRLDALAHAEHREITRALARQILEHEDRTLGLFD